MRHTLTSVLLLILCFLAGTLPSCKHDPQGLENLDIICFNNQVAPILVAHCSVCHSDNDAKGGYIIDSVYNNVLNLVNPGKPWASKLYNIVSSPNNPNMMPPNKALSREQLTILEVWIAQGANNIICSPNSPIQPIASNDGAILYSTYCVNCHGTLANSAKIGATSTQIQAGISAVPDMKSLSILTTVQKQAVADVLVGTPNANPDGAALYASTCAKCHSPLATSSAGRASTSKINQAILNVRAMKYLYSLSVAQISAISVALQSSSGSND